MIIFCVSAVTGLYLIILILTSCESSLVLVIAITGRLQEVLVGIESGYDVKHGCLAVRVRPFFLSPCWRRHIVHRLVDK